MGITARVMSNCYQEGKCTPCPFPDNLVFDEHLGPILNLPYEGNEGKHERFRDWLQDCCEYANMDQVSVFVASWKDFREFMDALESIGKSHFPTLSSEIGEGDEGITRADKSALALKELAFFQSQEEVMHRAVLVDTERELDVSMGSRVMGGALTMDRTTGFDLGFDDEGFFVRDRWELNRELFRAMRVEQRLLHPETTTVEFEDLDSGTVYQCSTPFGKIITGEDGVPRMYLQRFHIEMRPLGPSRFAHILGALTDAFEASVETGNPVRWS